MSIISKLFGGAPAAAQPMTQQQLVQQQQQLPTPGNIPNAALQGSATVSNAATAPNGVIPETGKQSPVPEFSDLWHIPDNTNTQGQPLFNISQDKLVEAARKQDFKGSVTPEQLAAIAQGGEAAQAALLDVMNTVSQNSYMQSIIASTKLIEGALEKQGYAKLSDIPATLRDTQLAEGLRSANPVFSNPAFAPFLDTARKQMQLKYPNATAQELQTQALKYVSSMFEQFNQPEEIKRTQQQTKVRASEDFSNWEKM